MYIRLLLLHFFALISSSLSAQQNDLYTDLYSTYFNNLALINPGYIREEGKAEFAAGYKSRTGPYRKIATYSFTAGCTFRQENTAAHEARLIFYNENEGPYIRKSRAYGNYAYVLPIYEHFRLTTGVALGFAQIAFSAPSATATGSALMPDGALGIMLQRKKLSAGFSSMQVLNKGVSVINAPFRLRRYYNFYLSTEKEINPFWTIKGYALWRLLPAVNDNADVAFSVAYKKILSLGASERYRQGMSFFISFSLNPGKDNIVLSFAYNSSFLGRNNGLLNSDEFAANYILGQTQQGPLE